MQGMWQQPMPGNFATKKKHAKEGWEMGPQKQQLPYPLTEKNLQACLSELNTGTRRAVETCIECFQNNRMSKEDLLCFMKSICSQGKTLKTLFSNTCGGVRASDADMAAIRAQQHSSQFKTGANLSSPIDSALSTTNAQFGDLATAEEMAELRALAAFSNPITAQKPSDQVCAVVHGTDVPVSAGATRPDTAPPAVPPKPKPVRVRRAKITEPTAEEKALMAWWSERRIPEVLRRQTESCNTEGCTSDVAKRVAYMKFVLTRLRDALPVAGKRQLVAHMAALHSSGNDEAFAAAVKELVDEHGVLVPLSFQAEVNVRVCTRRRVVGAAELSMGLGEEDWEMEEEEVPILPKVEAKREAEGDGKGEPAKRKRTETRKGPEPKGGEDEEADARCPVCVGCPQEDDRWVKCDGCASWYHQICVLFNEQAHGKSVRFFCRTPGCRKRGSRQLNRRQRKPCYPSSPGLEDSVLGRRLSEFAQQFSRSDRQVVVKMAANQGSVREVRRGRGGEERVQSKTLLCFQHTMIGSDLLFLVLFVEEVRRADGSGRVEVTHIDSNGLYEGVEDGERKRVESAVVVGFLEYAAEAGFAEARIAVRDPSQAGGALFHARPAAAWRDERDVRQFTMSTLAEARSGGLVLAYGEAEDGEEEVVVQLNAEKSAVEAEGDVEMRSGVAGQPAEWAALMAGNNYRFDSLQFAKFSSMMLVYHVIKGAKRDAGRTAAAAATPAPASGGALPPLAEGSDEEEEEEEEEPSQVPASAKRRRTDALSSLKREERGAAVIQQHIPQPPPRPLQSTNIFESPMVHASANGIMPPPMVRYNVFPSAPSESPAIRASAWGGALESPATRSAAFRCGMLESPAVASSTYRGPAESPLINASLWRNPSDSPAIAASAWRGIDSSPAICASAWRGPGESPYTRPSAFPGESPYTRPSAFPGESPYTRPSAFTGESPYSRFSAFPGESPYTRPSAFPGESPYTRPSAFPGESPATRPDAFPGPGESPSLRASAFPVASPSIRAIMASPHWRSAGGRAPPRVPSLGASNQQERELNAGGGGGLEPVFSFSDAMLDDVVEQSLGSAFATEGAPSGGNQDPFWDNFLTHLQH